MQKFLITLTLFIFANQICYAQDIAIKITPKYKYTTSTLALQEGDYLEFKVVEDVGDIKKDTIVTGLLTERCENGFEGKVGSLYVEQLKMGNKSLNGVIYQKGNPHELFLEHFFSSIWVRGGEAFLIPDKDVFTVYLRN